MIKMRVYSGATHFEVRTIAAALSAQRLTRRIVDIKMAATFIFNLQLNRTTKYNGLPYLRTNCEVLSLSGCRLESHVPARTFRGI